jgi:hypothetical protein
MFRVPDVREVGSVKDSRVREESGGLEGGRRAKLTASSAEFDILSRCNRRIMESMGDVEQTPI